MQSVSFRIWTRFAVFISYDDNYYTTGISSLSLSLSLYIYIYIFPGLTRDVIVKVPAGDLEVSVFRIPVTHLRSLIPFVEVLVV